MTKSTAIFLVLIILLSVPSTYIPLIEELSHKSSSAMKLVFICSLTLVGTRNNGFTEHIPPKHTFSARLEVIAPTQQP